MQTAQSSPSQPTADRRLLVLTGRSGAGKQQAARCFEDMGWRVVDNLPPRFLPLLLKEIKEGEPPLCLVCDVRGGSLPDLLPALDALRAGSETPTLLFLDASDETLVRRFKETRRAHPLFDEAGGIVPAVAAERERLAPLRIAADEIIDTTELAPSELRRLLFDLFAPQSEAKTWQPLTVSVVSFGAKHGPPGDADLVFDVRFLNNPHYEPNLRPLTGQHKDVEAFVSADERTACFLERLYDMVGWLLPQYVGEGKAYLSIAIGCTGGRHRSVVVAEKLARFVEERGYRTVTRHRDIEKA